jgi:hypothetical protein
MKKYIRLIILCCYCCNGYAQNDNIFLDGDNYVNTGNNIFPATITFTALSDVAQTVGSYPEETYWFVKGNDAHIIVHIADNQSNLFMELSGKKSTYHFPQDFSENFNAANDFSLELADNNGTVKGLKFSNKNPVTVHVDKLDSLHLKLSFEGTPVPSNSADAPVTITGKISLSKKNAALQKLPDEYNGCDNTIYNKWSPESDLNQWRSATACEINFHHKVWSTITAALEPAFNYLRSKKWICIKIEEKKLEDVYRNREDQLYNFKNFGRLIFSTQLQSDPTELGQSNQADKIIALSKKLGELTFNPPPEDSARVNKERNDLQQQLTNIGSDINDNKQINLEVKVNEALPDDSYYATDGSNAIIKKTNGGYIVENIKSKGSNSYNTSGGTYIFLGSWQEPQQDGSNIHCTPNLTAYTKKLSIQSIYIRIGCGNELANEFIQHINFTLLQKLFQLEP